MLEKSKLEDRLEESQLKIQELSIQLDKLDREYQQLLLQAGFTSEQAHHYLADANNFSQSQWNRLQQEKKKLDEKLDLSLKAVKDPLQLKKKFAERGNVQSHWLFVR